MVCGINYVRPRESAMRQPLDFKKIRSMQLYQAMKTLIAALITLALAACTTPPTDQKGKPLTIADAGPAPGDAMEAVRSALRYRLKDFESAKIELPLRPRPAVFARAAGLNQGGAGWELCPMVNAKNSFGGYTGFKPIFILWNTGQVIDFNASEIAEFWCRDKNDARLEVGPRLQ